MFQWVAKDIRRGLLQWVAKGHKALYVSMGS